MRIDPKERIAGQPALLVRQTLRRLRDQLQWRVEDLESTASAKAKDNFAGTKKTNFQRKAT